MANRLIEPISSTTKITKPRLVAAINSAVAEINQLHTLYDQFFTSVEDRPAFAKIIEDKLTSIKDEYSKLFDSPEGSMSKIQVLNNEIEAIREFHRKLTEGEPSIQVTVENAYDRISKFYTKLFQTYETDQDGGQESKLQAAFNSIISFDEDLNKADTGHRASIEEAKGKILSAYKDLFTKDSKTKVSKIDQLNAQISKTDEYHRKITDEIAPYIKDKQVHLDKLSSDIETKQREVDSLLSSTTLNTLGHGYKEAMQIYGSPVYSTPRSKWWRNLCYRSAFTYRLISHFLKFIGSYFLFIAPLFVIGWLFVSDSQSLLNIAQDGNVHFSGTEYIAYKLTIALPLLWVSWYGQKSIAHRKRLFEEYNHKLRVVQMYLQFITKTDTYVLNADSRNRLENTVLDTISKNPSEVYGKDETLLDKIISLIKNRTPKQKGKPEPHLPNPLNVKGSRTSVLD